MMITVKTLYVIVYVIAHNFAPLHSIFKKNQNKEKTLQIRALQGFSTGLGDWNRTSGLLNPIHKQAFLCRKYRMPISPYIIGFFGVYAVVKQPQKYSAIS